MAPKSRTVETPNGDKAKRHSKPAATIESRNKRPAFEVIGLTLAILALAALGSPISQQTLSPVYGSIPAAIYHKKGITFTVLLAYIVTKSQKNIKPFDKARDWIAPYAYYIPVIQWLLFQQSFKFGPRYGPLITEALTYFPVLLLSFLSSANLLQDLDLDKYGTSIADAAPAVLSYILFTGMEHASNILIPQIIGTSEFFTRSGLQLVVATLSALVSRSSMLMFAVPAMLHSMYNNPHNYATKTGVVLNRTLSEYRYSVLERQDSLTGYISVLENHKDGFRALRCDHSILGGEWLLTEESKKRNQVVPETIYSAFTMLEAVRMIKSEVFVPDDERDALFIGLGIGTAPKAFIQHGINTTVVEIDPVVHDFATRYFDLPTTHTKVISDAVSWVERQSVENPESYDYIVHDVFTGGAEPIPLFTLEFLRGLDALLKEDGAIAINYAGHINQPPCRIVLNTITAVFPNCRIFRDTLPDDPEPFLNMVVFCTKNTATPITFRLSKNEDYLDSLARRAYLPPDEGHEMILANIGGGLRKYGQEDILTRGNEKIIEEFHQDAALRHWKVMRRVMPDAVWENW